jgi:anthranilate synthase component 1
VVHFFERSVPIHPNDDMGLPEFVFMIARIMIVFDHRLRRLHVVSNAYVEDPEAIERAYSEARERLNQAAERLRQTINLRQIFTGVPQAMTPARSNTTRQEFEGIVEQARELIAAGDIFQVVLSQRFETDFSGDALDLYRALRFGNPSPYMFCLDFGTGFSVLGSSPELHVRSRGGLMEIRPIAGTKPRGADPATDERLAQELLRDPKERAEHVMLIDLARNDLGRVAEFGSVRVTEQMVIERYSHVMHIVSHVTARLRENQNVFDAIRATFPAGTVSGAPKIRAMQIIAELEKARRGFYSGIVGYFGFDGALDSCIALRSIVLKNNKAYFQTGAGIVADSNPGREYEECVNKAKAMLEAIARANMQ